MSIHDFTFDRKNPKQLLHAQAVVTAMILDSYCQSSYATTRIHRIARKAQERVYRRYRLAYN